MVAGKLAGCAGLLLVLVWLLSPACHWMEHSGGADAKHQHNEASCPVCQVAAHGAVVGAAGSPAVVPVDLQHLPQVPLRAGFVSFAPGFRAHSPRGPPSA